ncbi:MAG: NAD-dependent epimerase/dehydratase family protein [Fuerstiella sp.]|nr:NAD-dependent epimerase/dehydratase family protein [Fuerstiella sp.]
MQALVTGGGGFLGRYVVEQLLGAGHKVRVFCRGRYDALSRQGVQVVQGDIRDAAAVTAVCEDMDAVFHIAAIPGIWGRWETYRSINLMGTQNVIQACRHAGVSRLIYTSSPSVVFDGNDHRDADESLPYPKIWTCHYPHSKALAEQAVMRANADGLRTTSLRPHLIWGPRDNHLIPRLIRKAKTGRLRRVGAGKNVVSVSYVENVAAAHLQVERSLRNSTCAAGKSYFINEPEAVNLWNWIDELLEFAGLPPIQKSISAAAAYRIGHSMELLWRLLPGEPPLTRFVASQLTSSHSYSIQAAVRDFGYSPVCTMQEGMHKLRTELAQLH